MNIIELGAIGELVGGVAVIGSLIYLALQVRGSAREQRAASMRESTREMASVIQDIAGSQERAEIWLKGMNDFDGLESAERLRFSGIVGHLLRLTEQLYYQSRGGGVEVWGGFENQLHDIAAYPGFVDWWPTRAHWYGAKFRTFVESHISAENRPRAGYGESSPEPPSRGGR